MSEHYSIFHHARVTIEFTTAFHVGAGNAAGAADAGVVRDANGLPTVPGSGIQGALRETLSLLGYNEAEWFGFDSRHTLAGLAFKDGRSSRISASWGLIHGSNDKPVEGILRESAIRNDCVLMDAFEPMLRDHVRMTHRKAADVDENGKFDEHAVSAGHRFTFELKLSTSPASNERDSEIWKQLLGVLNSPRVRFGGKTRRGFGNFKVVRVLGDSFDLSKEEDRNRWLAWPVRLGEAPAAPVLGADPALGRLLPFEDVSITLEPQTPWMIGGGSDDDADSAPVRARRVAWSEEQGNVHGSIEKDCWLVPGTSVKGALAHRVCYHANRLAGIFFDRIGEENATKVTGARNAVVKALFGEILDSDDGTGTRGKVMVDDFLLPHQDAKLMASQNHVSIDPFTSGAKDTALFQDRPLRKGVLSVPVFIEGSWEDFPECEILPGHNACPKAAFEAALADLETGLLPIGAHASRGYGVMRKGA